MKAAGVALEALAVEQDDPRSMRTSAAMPHGMLFVTGPTGKCESVMR